jgi:protein-S-isoprenylcysteine O-methyltransferase Ste14
MTERAISSGKSRPPASVTHMGLNTIALGCLLVMLGYLRYRHQLYGSGPGQLPRQSEILLLLGSVAVPVVFMDLVVLKVHKRATTGLDWVQQPNLDIARILTKLLGLALTLGVIALAYWAFAEYHGSFYDPFYAALRRFWLPLVIASVGYVSIVDGQMVSPRDTYWQLGRVVLFHPSDARAADVANHFRSWLVKAYFIPLMVVWMHGEASKLVTFDLAHVAWTNLRGYDFLYDLIFGVDLLFCTCGYILSFRVIDTHVRSAEPTMYGWVVALFCYQPFYSLMEAQYVRYSQDYGFGTWLGGAPVAVRWAWAGTILALISIYSLGTVTFGVRFSNLTHRGILTNGPYRFTKHPAYITKNLSWWLVSVPFVPHTGVIDAIRHSLLLGCVNSIYFFRAKTEEAHLSRDPTYVEYALWMNDHGTLRFLGRWFPVLRYKAPASYVAPSATPSPPDSGAVTATHSSTPPAEQHSSAL